MALNSEYYINQFKAIENIQTTHLRQIKFEEPVSYVYNPLEYASEPHQHYLQKFCTGPKKVIFLGMNPGPFGMVQTGVPFGEVMLIRDWLKISGSIYRPPCEHPKRPILGFSCERREVSGQRFWGLIHELSGGNPDIFFKHCLVHNYCPLAFMTSTGKNVTLPQLRAGDRRSLMAICDEALKQVVFLLQPSVVVGVGKYAEERCQEVLAPLGIRVCGILHPSPANPATNKGWDHIARDQLRHHGILDVVCGIDVQI